MMGQIPKSMLLGSKREQNKKKLFVVDKMPTKTKKNSLVGL